MSSKKRRGAAKTSNPSFVTPGPPAGPPARKLGSGACSGCRARKIRCTFAPNSTVCNKCTEGQRPEECIVQESRTRARSTAPSNCSSKPVKRGPTPTPQVATTTSDFADTRAHDISSATGHLDPIVELDQLDTFDDYRQFSGSEYLSIVTDMNPVEFDEADGDDVRSEEDFELDGVTAGDDEDSSDPGCEMDDDVCYEKPVARRAPARLAPAGKSVGKAKAATTKPTGSYYDPASCVFKIQCAVHQSQGSKLTNIPFQISLDITLDRLCEIVAEKLDRFPRISKLQYRLDCKAKTAFTSLQSDEELRIFIETMRPLIVPPRLANGKASTRAMKPVTVYFEDSTSQDGSLAPASIENRMNAGTKGAVSSSKRKHSPTTNEVEDEDRQQEYVEALQKRWRCDIHSRGSESDTYCYTLGNVCYALSHAHISLWALEIMNGNATVDTKPPTVPAHTARPRTRNMGSGTVVDQYPSAGQHSYPSPPVTVQVIPPWPGTAQGYLGGNGTLYPPFSQQTIHPPPAVPAYPLSPNLQPTIPQPHRALSPFDPVMTSNSSETTGQAPKVVPWFNYLEQREKDPPCGVKFGVFGPMLEVKGFVRISQLSRDYISVEVLQRLLGIEMGTAVLILQYVEADMRAISSGRSVLPEEF